MVNSKFQDRFYAKNSTISNFTNSLLTKSRLRHLLSHSHHSNSISTMLVATLILILLFPSPTACVNVVNFASSETLYLTEGEETRVYLVRTGAELTNPITVNGIITGDANQQDFTLAVVAAFFNDQQSNSSYFTISPINDTTPELNETFTLTISQVSDAQIGSLSARTLIIWANDDPNGVVSYHSNSLYLSLPEPMLPSAPKPSLTVVRIGTFGAVNVGWRFISDPNGDFSSQSGIVTFIDGEDTVTIELPIMLDSEFEEEETFQVELISVDGGARLSDSETTAQITITINDIPVSFLCDRTVFPENVNEIVCNITRGLDSEGNILIGTISHTSSVLFSTQEITAESQSDYLAIGSVVEFTASSYSEIRRLTILDDSIPEDDEVLNLTLTSPTSDLLILTPAVSLTIRGNDGAGGIASIQQGTEIIVNEGANAVFNIVRTESTVGVVSVFWEVIHRVTNDSIADDDTISSGIASIQNGESGGQLIIPIIADFIPEPSEQFTVRLIRVTSSIGSLANNALLSTNFIIRDSDQAYGLVEWSTDESLTITTDPRQLLLRVERKQGLTGRIAVNYSVVYTVDGSLNNPITDYLSEMSSFVIENGVDHYSIILGIGNNAILESTGSFYASLHSVELQVINGFPSILVQPASSPILSTTRRNVHIPIPLDAVNGKLGFSAESLQVSVTEGNSTHSSQVRLTVVREGSSSSVSIAYSILSVSNANTIATSDIDHSFTDTLMLLEGETQSEISISIRDDNIPELDEVFIVRLTSTNDINQIINSATSDSMVTILASDYPGGIINISSTTLGPYTISESGTQNTQTINLLRTGSTLSRVGVRYEIVTDQGVEGSDDFFTNGIAFINAGETETSIMVIPKDDNIPELDEVFHLRLTSIVNPEIARIISPSEVEITISESDFPYGRFSFSNPSYSVLETPSDVSDPTQYNSVSIMLQRQYGTLSEVSVQWRVEVAANNTDVSPLEGTLIFYESMTSREFAVTILPDDFPETDETFIIVLHTPTGGAAIDPTADQTSLTITGNDDPITFTQAYISVAESSGSSVLVTITREGRSSGVVQVNLRTEDVSAISREDYQPVSLTLSFTDGVNSLDFSTTIIDDDLPEDEETFRFILSSAIGDAVIGDPGFIEVLIAPNDDPNGIIFFSESSRQVTANEGSIVSLDILRDRGVFGEFTLQITAVKTSTDHPTLPVSPVDISFNSAISVPEGATNITLNVQIIDDSVPEFDETYLISITCPISSSLNPGPECGTEARSSVITIPTNDDPYGAYGFAGDVYIPEDLTIDANANLRTHVLAVEQLGGTLGSASLLWEITSLDLALITFSDLLFYSTINSGVTELSPSNRRNFTGTTAYLFAGGVNSYATVSNQYVSIVSSIVGGFTFSMFIRGTSASNGYLLTRHNQDGSTIYYGLKLTNTPNTRVEFDFTLTPQTAQTVIANLPSDAFNGEWSHLCVVFITLNNPEVRLYYRGSLINSTSIGSGQILDVDNGITTVGANAVGQNRIQVQLQDFRLYHTVLSATQVLAIASDSISQDIYPLSGYSSFSVGQTSDTVATLQVVDDSIPEPLESFILKVANLKGDGRIHPEASVRTVNILSSETGNGIFSFKSLTSVSIADEIDTASITLSRTHAFFGGVSVHWEVYYAEGVNPAIDEFNPYKGSVLFSNMQEEAQLILEPLNDIIPELVEHFHLRLTGATLSDGTTPSTPTSAYQIISQNLSVTLQENDSPYGYLQFSSSLVPVPDNQFIPATTIFPTATTTEEAGNITLQIVRAQGNVGMIQVSYVTSRVTATDDFASRTGTVSFADGQRSKFISIQLNDDSEPEISEVFQVILSNPGGNLGTPDAFGIGAIINVTILPSDDAFGVLSFTSSSRNNVVNEVNGTVSLEIQRTRGLLGPITAYWSLTGPVGLSDITPTNGALTFGLSVSSSILTLNIREDSDPEFLEEYTVTLMNVTGGGRLSELGDAEASISIQASDYPHGLFQFPSSQRSILRNEGEIFTLNINRAFGTFGIVRLYYSTVSNEATPDSDYISISSSFVVYNDNETLKQIQITILNDTIPEIDEQFTVILDRAELISQAQPGMPIPQINSGAAGRSNVIIVENDDAHGILSFQTTSLSISESDGANFISVRRSTGLFGVVTVDYSVTLTTAQASDLSALTGTVTIPENTDEMFLSLMVLDDGTPELDERFSVTLTNPTGGAVLASSNLSTTVVILENDDVHGVFEFRSDNLVLHVTEPDITAYTASLNIIRSFGSVDIVKISWIATLNGIAPTSDISPTSGEVVFQNGQITNTFQIQILPDDIPEGLETISVSIAIESGRARTGSRSVATLNILSNDAPHGVVSLASSNIVVMEGDADVIARIPLIREFGNLGDLEITYFTTDISIIDLAYPNDTITPNYYFTGGQSILLTDAPLPIVDLQSSSDKFKDCSDLCLELVSCLSLAYSDTQCLLYQVSGDNSGSTANSSFLFYRKLTTRTEPLERILAQDGVDYVGTNTSNITIPNGQDAWDIEVTIRGDTIPEFSELFSITLTNLTLKGITVDDPANTPVFGSISTAQIEIARSDSPFGLFRVSLSGGNQSLSVMENHTELIISTIYRDLGTMGTVTVHVSLLGSATAGVDYIQSEAVYTFREGETETSISFRILEDDIAEGDETIIIQLDDPTDGADVIEGEASRVIIQISANDNGGGIISIPSSSVNTTVKEDRINPIRICRKVGTSGRAEVNWDLIGTGVENQFANTIGIALFEDGSDETFIYLIPINDTARELAQIFILTLRSARSVDISPTGNAILDPDTSVLSASIILGESDLPHGVVQLQSNQTTFTLQEGTSSDIMLARLYGTNGILRVYFVSKVGNLSSLNEEYGPSQLARADINDIVTTERYVDIPDGISSLLLPLTIVDDTIPEFDEVFILELSRVELLNSPPFPPSAIQFPTIGRNFIAEILIPTNDSPFGTLQFSQGQIDVTEDDGQINLFIARVDGTLGEASCIVQITNTFRADGGENGDFRFSPASFSWANGEGGSRSISIELISDEIPEGDEIVTISLEMVTPSEVQLGENRSIDVVILGNDLGKGTFTIDPLFASTVDGVEGEVIIIPIRRIGYNFSEVQLRYRTLPESNQDIIPSSGVIIFSDSQTESNLVIEVLADGIAELVEEITVEILLPVKPQGTQLGERTTISISIRESDYPYGRFQTFIVQDNVRYYKQAFIDEDVGLQSVSIERPDGTNGAVTVSYEVLAISTTPNTDGTQYTLSVTQDLERAAEWYSFTKQSRLFTISASSASSSLYLWRGNFKKIQTFQIQMATSWQSFTWDGTYYLAVSSGTSNTIIQIYSYNTVTMRYELYQSISQSDSISHLHLFITNEQLYMFASVRATLSQNTNTMSLLYSWNSSSLSFTSNPVQQIPTYGARQSETFTQNGLLYLVIVNSYDTNEQTSEIVSALYQWISNSQEFQYVSNFTTIGAESLSLSRTSDSTIYIFVSNSTSVTAYRFSLNSFTIAETIFLSGLIRRVRSVFFIPLLCPVVTVAGDNSVIYIFNGLFTPVPLARINSLVAFDFYPIEIDNLLYLLTASSSSTAYVLGPWSESAEIFLRHGMLYFDQREAELTISVEIYPDILPELVEEFIVILSNPTNQAVLHDVNANLTIGIRTNDDAHGVIGFDSTSVASQFPELSDQDIIREQNFFLDLVRLGGSFGVVVVNFSVSGVAFDDVNPTEGTVTFLDGQTSAFLPIHVINDSIPELSEIATYRLVSVVQNGNTHVNISSNLAARINPASDIATVTIQANDYPHGLLTWVNSSKIVSINEPESGLTATVTLGIIREYGAIGDIIISYSTELAITAPPDRQASPDTDFVSISSSHVTINTGFRTASVILTILPDMISETFESFLVRITDVSLVDESARQGSMSDSPRPLNTLSEIATIIISPSDEFRGVFEFAVTFHPDGTLHVEEDVGLLSITILRTHGAFGDVGLSWTATPITSSPSDFSPENNTVSFLNDQSISYILINITDDTIPEFASNFSISLHSAMGGARIGSTPQITVTIEDSDDIFGRYGFSQDSLSSTLIEPGDNGTAPSFTTLTVVRSGASTVDVIVFWEIETTASDDVTPTNGQLNFSSGVIELNFIINVIDDNLAELEEIYQVTLISATNNGNIGASMSELFIYANDEPTGRILISPSDRVIVAEEGSRVSINLLREQGAFFTVNVLWGIFPVNSSSNISQDFIQTSGIATFPKDTQMASILVQIINDTVPETFEVFRLQLLDANISGSSQKPIIDSSANSALLYIGSSDTPHGTIRFVDTSSSYAEDSGLINIEITRGLGVSGKIRVNFSITTSTAVVGDDYIINQYYIDIDDGENIGLININIINDVTPELDEYFQITLTSVSLIFNPISPPNISDPENLLINLPPVLGTTPTHTLTIYSSDDPYGTIEFSRNFYSFQEGELANITVLRTGGSIGVSSVTYRITNGSSTLEDYNTVLGSQGDLVFLEGVSSVDLMIEIIDDTIPEDYENFYIFLFPNVTGLASIGSLLSVEVQIEISDDIYGVIGFSESSLSETFENPSANEEPIGHTLSIVRDRGTMGSVTVQYVIFPTDELQQVNEDIMPQSGTLTFGNGVSVQFISLLILGNTGPEVEDIYIVSLVNSTSNVNPSRVNATLTIKGKGMPYGYVGFVDGFSGATYQETNFTQYVNFPIRRTVGTHGNLYVYWEIIGNVSEEIIYPLSGNVLLPHYNSYDRDITMYPTYNLTLSILPDSAPELTHILDIRLINTSIPAEILASADSVVLTIQANDAPHGVFSIDSTTLALNSNLTSLSREFSFAIIRSQGIFIDALVSYSLYHSDPLGTGGDTNKLIASGLTTMTEGLSRTYASLNVSPSAFIGTNSTLTVRLTNVSLNGVSEKNLPPIIYSANSEFSITVDEQHANPRIFFSPDSLIATIDDNTYTTTLLLLRTGYFGDSSIIYTTRQANLSSGIRDGIISPPDGAISFSSFQRNATLTLTATPTLSPEVPEIFIVRLLGDNTTSVASRSHDSYSVSRLEPFGVVGIASQQLITSVVESEGVVIVDIYRLYGSEGQIFITYTTLNAPDDSFHPIFAKLAVEGQDYNRSQNLEIMQDKQTRTQISIQIFTNVIAELDRLFMLDLSLIEGSTGGMSRSPRFLTSHTSSLITILDDDYPAGVFQFPVDNLYLAEENIQLVILIQRNSTNLLHSADVSVRTVDPSDAERFGVDYSTLGINFDTTVNAIANIDYVPFDMRLTFSGNTTEVQITLTILDDQIPELDSLILLQLYNSTYHSMISSILLPIIIGFSDNAGGIIRFSDDSLILFISEDSQPSILVNLTRDAGTILPITVQWQAKTTANRSSATVQETIALNRQLVDASGQVTFAQGENTASFSITLKQDQDPEVATTFYILLRNENLAPIAVIDSDRNLATIISDKSDFPYGGFEFASDSRFLTVFSSNSSNFNITLTVSRVGGTLEEIRVNYETPFIFQESILLGTYVAKNAIIDMHYKSADGTLIFSEGVREATINLQILREPLIIGESRVLYVDLMPESPGERATYYRGTVILTGSGFENTLLVLYSQLLSRSITAQQTCESILTHLQGTQITGTLDGQAQLVRSILNQLITDGVNGDYDSSLKQCVLDSLSNVIGGTEFRGKDYFTDVIETFSYSVLSDQPCPSTQSFILKSDKLDIIARQGFSTDLSGYTFTLNGNAFIIPSNVLSSSPGERCGSMAYMADMDVSNQGIFLDSQVENLFGQTVLSVGVRSFTGEKITSLSNPLTYRVNSPDTSVKFKNSKCLFWDTILQSWSTEGCAVIRQYFEQPYIECECDHLTSFTTEATSDYRYALGISMSVLCFIVILAVISAIVAHILYYTKMQLVTHLILNLMVAILLTELITLFNSLFSPIANLAACSALGALLHYFMLVTFIWTLIIVIATLLVMHFASSAYEILQLVLYVIFGWVIPAIVLLITVLFSIYGGGLSWTDIYGDVHGNGDLCFIPNHTVNILSVIVPVVICVIISLLCIAFQFALNNYKSKAQDLKLDDIYFTSKNTYEIIKLAFLFLLMTLVFILSALHLRFGNLFLLILVLIAQLALAIYIVVVYCIIVAIIFFRSKKKLYYLEGDIADVSASLSPQIHDNNVVAVSYPQPHSNIVEEKIYSNSSILESSSIAGDSIGLIGPVIRESLMTHMTDPTMEDLLKTLKAGDQDPDLLQPNFDTSSDMPVEEIYAKRRISIKDTPL